VEHQLINIENCPICACKNNKQYISATDHNVSGDSFNIVSCNDCSFKFTNPIPSKETIGKYYKSENYISHSGTKKGLINFIYHKVRNRQLKMKYNLISSLSNNKSILDIGCGTGEFIDLCKNKSWEVLGLEPDIDARKLAKKNHNIDLLDQVELYNINKNKVSIITLWHVLEHVYNLQKDLKQYANILKDNGYLIIAVPNCNSYDAQHYKEHWAAYDLPIHLYHFTQKDIINLASKTGFKLIKTSPLFYDAFYISMLSEKKKGGNFLKAIYLGLKSNLKAKQDNNYSSLIYILQKN
jgi:2-polyprenyl-3-methyl-5-hydroxy-6-metoxy-1,4-benzoquinol methylase